ncbi:MAG: hypothetical protein L3J96_06325 [Thermoplasmata archaeon]|nr:hypothetical protein [Thermoplasmata archaeon]
MAEIRTVAEALQLLGLSPDRAPSRPILHGPAGTLGSIALRDEKSKLSWVGVWVAGDQVSFLGPVPPGPGPSVGHHLEGNAARLFDLLADAGRIYLERVEEIDAQLATLQEKGRSVPLSEVWALQRRVAGTRAQIGRALVIAAEFGGPFGAAFPGFPDALPSLSGELTRLRELAASVSQSLSDLILLRNAEDSNRLADTANELSRLSNRIASLANTSNVRMLGLSYIALVLGLTSVVVLIPNTAATILGMPSAGWVPGLWVDLILVVLAVVPLYLVFSRRWVLRMLNDLKSYENRVSEGVDDLPEMGPDPNPTRPPPPK